MTSNTLNSAHSSQSLSNGSAGPMHNVIDSMRSSRESANTVGLSMLRSSLTNSGAESCTSTSPTSARADAFNTNGAKADDPNTDDLSIAAGPMHEARLDFQEEVCIRTGKSLLGLVVVGQTDGTILGRVRDLIFNLETNQLIALVLNEKDLFGLINAQIVPWDEVDSLGQDAVLVRSAASTVKLKDYEPLRAVTHQRESILSGTEIVTADGRHLGTLADICIDKASGQVVGYEVAKGFIADTLHGKKFLPAPPKLAIGQDAAIAPANANPISK